MGRGASPAESAPAVVIVEDDPAVLAALVFAFQIDGFEVHPFGSAEAVLAAALPLAACLVLDQRLPGADGLELLDRLRTRNVRLPAVLVTTNPSPDVRRRADLAGAPIVEKPLITDGLLQTVRSRLADATSA